MRPKGDSAKESDKENLISLSVKKSNALIQAIGKPSLLASKVLLAALMNAKEKDGSGVGEKSYYRDLEKKTGVNFAEGLVAELTNSDLRHSMGSVGGSYYRDIKELMDPASNDSLCRQWGIFMADHESKLYSWVTVITAVAYDGEKRKMYIKFSGEQIIKDQIINLKKSYTLLNYNLMMRFKSTYTYRIYELLMSDMGLIDYKNGREKQDEYRIRYGVSELKYKLGVLDPFLKLDVRSAIAKAKTEDDFTVIEENIAKENKMPRFRDFKKYALETAKNEINSTENVEFTLDYLPVKKGRKVGAIEFIVTRIKKDDIVEESGTKVTEEKNPIELLTEISTVQSFIEEKLTALEVMELLETAGHDIDKIRTAYDVASKYRTEIKNLVGFLKKAITEGYTTGVKKANLQTSENTATTKSKNRFINFEQDEVDYDEIAKQKILKRTKGTT